MYQIVLSKIIIDLITTTKKGEVKMGTREQFEEEYGQVWDTSEVTKDFEIHSFLAPYCVVTRRNDGIKGVLEFNDRPRYYFDFREIK